MTEPATPPLRSEQARDWHKQYPAMAQREIARRTGLSLYAVQCAITAEHKPGRPKGEAKASLVTSLPLDLLVTLRAYCKRNGVTLSSVVERALRRELP